MKMRSIFIAMLMTAGIAMLGSSPGLAAPAYGIAIGNAASFGVVTEQAGWGYWRHRHHHHRHHHYRRWW
jgi:hypothetical protein